MNLLAIETATDACSVGLLSGGERLFDHRVEPRQHSRLVLPMIDALLAEAGLPRSALDGVVFGRGPGSFTGVRVAASVTQGIALGLDIGVIGISTLATIAQGCHRDFGDERVGVALDARLDEVYWGAYSVVPSLAADVMQACGSERVCLPDAVTLGSCDATNPAEPAEPALTDAIPAVSAATDSASWQLAGAGAERYGDVMTKTLGLEGVVARHGRFPHAQDLLTLAWSLARRGDFSPPESAVPVYLRERVALTEVERGIGRR